jgi:hypothetical protein
LATPPSQKAESNETQAKPPAPPLLTGFEKKRDENDMKKTAFVENVILTIKLLVVLSLLGAALWGLELWIS